MHWFCMNFIIRHCKNKVILITCCVLVLYLVSSTRFSSKLNLPMYDKSLPYIYRHIWWSPILLPGWSCQWKHVKTVLFWQPLRLKTLHIQVTVSVSVFRDSNGEAATRTGEKKLKGIIFWPYFHKQTQTNPSKQSDLLPLPRKPKKNSRVLYLLCKQSHFTNQR